MRSCGAGSGGICGCSPDAGRDADYIAHRFRIGNAPVTGGRQPFDAGGLWLIHEASGGNPGQIVRLVRHCLSRERMAPGGRMDEVFVHACLSDLAQAGTCPTRLPDLLQAGYTAMKRHPSKNPLHRRLFRNPMSGRRPRGMCPCCWRSARASVADARPGQARP